MTVAATQLGHAELAADIAAYLAMKRKRADALGGDLFGDPAWDILLDLYVAEAESRQVSVTMASIATGAAMTTGLRWVGELVRRKLLTRTDDRGDGRRSLLALTPRSRDTIERLWRTTVQAGARGG